MSDRAKLLVEQFRAMTPEEQDEFLDELWQSGADEGPPNPYPDESAWRAEIERRSDEAREHPERLSDWSELKAEMLARYSGKRP